MFPFLLRIVIPVVVIALVTGMSLTPLACQGTVLRSRMLRRG